MRAKTIGIALTIGLGSASVAHLSRAIAATPNLERSDWKLSAWTGTTLVKDTAITLSFTGTNLAGSAGCNRYIASYQRQQESLSVKPEIATTMMACPEPLMKQETRFLTALKGVREYAINAAGELQLVYRLPEGLGILTFTRDSRTGSPKR